MIVLGPIFRAFAVQRSTPDFGPQRVEVETTYFRDPLDRDREPHGGEQFARES